MMKLWRRLVLWGGLGLILLVGLTYAFWPQPVPVDFAEVARGELIVTVDEEGETRVKDIFVLSAPVGGRSRRIEAEVGDEVVAGETVIAEIEPIDPAFLDVRTEAQAEAAVKAAEAALALAQADLERDKAELRFAETELERARRLIEKGNVSERALDQAERTYRTSVAAVDTAQAALQMRTFELAHARARLVSPIETHGSRGSCACVPITAPVSGRVLRVLHESEGVVEPGEALVEIGDPRDLEIVVDLLSSDAVKVREGQRVIVEDWGGGTALAGRVRRVEPYGFTKVSALGIEEQRVNVIIDLSDSPERWQALGHGYRVEARIVLWEGREVLKVPLSALFRNGTDWAVFVDSAARAAQRGVKIGQRTDLEVEILDGLREGERVILHPSTRVTEGARVDERQ
ncbi:MAG: HlyD family efflux transporter periplasmic adaptor subunit [Pseudomonadota bacterium]